MMERQGDSQVSMMIVDLDEFVPANHLLRQIKRKVDFAFIYDKVKHLYKAGDRWFLGLPLNQRVPDHSTRSNNRNGRFKNGTLFLDLFEGIVDQCKQAGLIEGKAVLTDSTHVKASQ